MSKKKKNKSKQPLKSLRMNPVGTIPVHDRVLIFFKTDLGSIRAVGEYRDALLQRVRRTNFIGWLPMPKFPKREKS